MYQICLSGASKGDSVLEGRELAWAAGQAVAEAGHALLTGATSGLPNYAAQGYKAAKGKISVGLSPAVGKIEHIKKYRLPTESYDSIIYTGLNYIGRDNLLITSADAVVSIGGRIGTLHEFTIAMESDTPIGFLQGAGGISSEIMDILTAAGEQRSKNVLFSEDANDLIKQLTEHLNNKYKGYLGLYS